MTDPQKKHRQLLTGAGLRFGMLIVSAVIGFFMTPFMVHELGDKLFGLWMLVGSFSGTYALLDLGLAGAVGRYVAMYIGKQDYKSVNVYVNTALVIYCIMSVFVVLAAFGLTFFASTFVDTPEDASLMSILVLIVGTELALSFPMRALTGTVTAKLRYDVSTTIRLVFKLVSTALIVSAILLGGQLITLALIGLSLGIIRGIVWYITVRRVTPEVEISPSLASKQAALSLFSFSIFAFIVQVAEILRFRVDNFVIGGFLGSAMITHYTVGVTLTSYFSMATLAFMGVLGPLFAQQHGQNDMAAIRRALDFGIRASISIVSFMAFGLIAWGQPFIERWMGPEYLDAYPCMAVVTIGYMAALFQTTTVGVFFAQANHHYYAISNGIEGVLNLVLSIIFVRYWGIFGVALATCVAMIAVKTTFQPWFICRVTRQSLPAYYLRILRAGLIAAIAFIVPSVITHLLVGPDYPRLFLTGFLCTMLYFPIVAIFNFSKDERQKVFRAILKR